MIVYFSFHISKTLKDIVKNSFYFSNRVEIERIIEHTLDMINDEKDEKGIHLRQETIHLLKDVLELNKPLSMETMIRFQLKKVDRKSTRLNSSHVAISYAVFCLKKKKK